MKSIQSETWKIKIVKLRVKIPREWPLVLKTECIVKLSFALASTYIKVQLQQPIFFLVGNNTNETCVKDADVIIGES